MSRLHFGQTVSMISYYINIVLIVISPISYMDDPTGGMWIYLIFFMFPLIRILPRIMRRIKAKNAGNEQPQPQEPFQQEPKKERQWMPKFEKESFFEEEKPDKKDGWLSKGDFK